MKDIAQAQARDTQLFRHVFNASPIGIAVETLEGQPLFVNPAFCSFLGFSEEELRNKHCVDFSPREDAEKDWALFQKLRAGSINQYQLEKRYFRQDGSLVWGRLSLSLLNTHPSPLVLAMVEDITEKKTAEELQAEMNRALEAQTATLRSQEELLKIFVKTVPAGVAMLDREMHYLQVSDRWSADYGVDASQILGLSHYEIFPDVPHRWKEIHRRALEGETLRAEEDRWDRRDGSATWVRWEIRPWRTPGGDIGGILILAEDITHRKQMEAALSEMTRKLVESQEQERARIGRELHDDITQRLVLLAIELEQLGENPSEVRNRAQTLRREITELSNDVQALSHELHASTLEYLGIVAGLKSWTREFGQRQKMEIDFKSDVPGVLPFEVGLCLFRVLQEALHNASKHSGVKRVAVQVKQHSNEVHLIVSDSGKGFDVEAGRHGSGLGLTSMRERVRLVNGTIAIESEPMGGTTIHVRVPLRSESLAERAAG